MKDRSSWTDEQINEEIFKLLGWMRTPPPAAPPWQRPSGDGVESWFFSFPPDYTHDWKLCGELFEEMQTFAVLTKNEFGWQCLSRFGSVSHKKTAGRAISELWLAQEEEK